MGAGLMGKVAFGMAIRGYQELFIFFVMVKVL